MFFVLERERISFVSDIISRKKLTKSQGPFCPVGNNYLLGDYYPAKGVCESRTPMGSI